MPAHNKSCCHCNVAITMDQMEMPLQVMLKPNKFLIHNENFEKVSETQVVSEIKLALPSKRRLKRRMHPLKTISATFLPFAGKSQKDAGGSVVV